MNRVILHSDMNNFYASVECLYQPELRNKPVAVGGDVEARHGIVLAKNMLAKAKGVITGEALWEAREKCPGLIIVPPHYDRYLQFSQAAREIYAEYTPQVERYGLDECWLDLTDSDCLHGGGEKVANEIRQRIKNELGITVSVGVSFNKIFAKLGSDYKKPDATTVITADSYKEIAWPLPVKELLFVGRATKKKLNRIGIMTIGDLANTNVDLLHGMLGVDGVMLWRFANGLDDSPVSEMGTSAAIKSIGNSTTTKRDLVTDDDMRITMYLLSESVAHRLRKHGFMCRTVQISLRDNELSSCQRQGGLPFPVNTSKEIFEKAFALYLANKGPLPYRSVGVRACNLVPDDVTQLSFSDEAIQAEKHKNLEEAIDHIRSRFGTHAIQRGIMLTDTDLSGLDMQDEYSIQSISFITG